MLTPMGGVWGGLCPQPRHMGGVLPLRCHQYFFFFCHLLHTPREERDRASGYRKRGPKPKRLPLQVTTVSEPPPSSCPACPHLHVHWSSSSLTHPTQHHPVLWNYWPWVRFSSCIKATCGIGAREDSLCWGRHVASF